MSRAYLCVKSQSPADAFARLDEAHGSQTYMPTRTQDTREHKAMSTWALIHNTKLTSGR